METAFSFIALLLSIFSVGFSLYTFLWTALRDRKQATLDAFNILQREAFDKLNLRTPAEIQEIAKHPTSREYKEVSGYIARIEHFCVGVNKKIYDRETVYQLAHGYLDGKVIVERISPIIDRKNRKADTDYYENIHKVLSWMKTKSEKSNR